jgi:hypothetical protein
MFRNFFNRESGSSGGISQNSTILLCIMGFLKNSYRILISVCISKEN